MVAVHVYSRYVTCYIVCLFENLICFSSLSIRNANTTSLWKLSRYFKERLA